MILHTIKKNKNYGSAFLSLRIFILYVLAYFIFIVFLFHIIVIVVF